MEHQLTDFGKSLIALMRELISVVIVLSPDQAPLSVYEIVNVDMSLAASANFLNCPLTSTFKLLVLTFAETFASTNSLSFLVFASNFKEAIR